MKSYSFPIHPALNIDHNDVSGKSNVHNISRQQLKGFFPKLVPVRSLKRSCIDSLSSAKKRCNTKGKELIDFKLDNAKKRHVRRRA